MKFYLPLIISLVFLAGCGSVSYQYQGEDGKVNYVMPVFLDSGKASFEFAAVTNYAYPLIENDYPSIQTRFSSDSSGADKIRRLDVKLIVEGREIEADGEEYQADYAGNFIVLDKEDCCARLAERLNIDSSEKNENAAFSVQILKKYKSLKTLPRQITVVLTATTDKGTTEMTKILHLVAFENTNFIRVH